MKYLLQHSGMLNAVGLQNKGVDYFCQHIYPQISAYDTAMIVNVSGSQVEDYIATAEKINDLEHIPAIELNISYPNVKKPGQCGPCPSRVAGSHLLRGGRSVGGEHRIGGRTVPPGGLGECHAQALPGGNYEIGRASCRERV